MPQRALGWAGWSAVAAPLRASNGDFGCRPASFCAAALPPARPPSARRKPTTHGPRPPPPPTTRCVCRPSPRPMPRPGPCLSWCLAGLAGWQRQDGWTGALSRFYRSHQSPAHAHSGAMQRSAPLCLVRRDSVCRLSPLPLADDHDDVMRRIVALLAETAPPRGPCSPPMTLRAALSSRPCFFWAKCAALDLAM